MSTAFVALGSNLSKREEYLSEAIDLLDGHEAIRVSKRSSVYETEPVGYVDQQDFLNMVVQVETSLSADQLLDQCQQIEQELGRKRIVEWGPRTIDLDILLFDDEHMTKEHLTVPHPHMHERAFVMVPLVDVAPTIQIPALHQTAQEILDGLPDEEVRSMRVWGEI
ncbi:2-amino-4-hydroxy-6-hydroxymethyldihydropteridine diphosphokinase [Halobacillus locisalis]|uniref:2-amino-4-hydroxy-6-hydroxymethyldihydropteridine diphosphokinase n=1 Tax=Halobacillus locisalis TaxID=220753 RepID=A0A838CZB5_9BACI|nr:2-amino-4-hydroxy-6-hydroxymethyldihydropteridine diphosphokinase [Halobacillus locisalis]MBA2177018.1 2-amino-4-hydroxy-6-hydroxymethyldihydropteridine diphosphokinase [Halobacillus locisalis]